MIEAFRELWEELPLAAKSSDHVRYYNFYGDDFPLLIFLGKLESITIYDLSITEETVNILDVQIIEPERYSEDPDNAE